MTVMLAITTAPDRHTAERLAEGMLERRLVACVNILPDIGSVYWWQDRLERADEVLLFMKTTQDRWPELEAFMREQHPYDTPELLALPISTALDTYYEWIQKETQTCGT